jgi:hypothetical protein
LPKKDPVRSPLASLVPILQGVVSLSVLAVAWSTFEPASFAAQALPVTRALGAGALAATGAYALWWRPAHPLTQTHEDYACGWYITGLPGSGKTAFAYLMVREFCCRGWGWIWLSIKSSLPLLQYLPEEARERCILFAPYSDHPRGLNFLRCYTGTATERELLSDQTAELFSRLHPHMSANMRELIRMGALALLQWADREQVEVTLWELYQVFQSEAFRSRVLAGAPKPLRDAFGADEARKQTLQAVRAQLRRSVTSENLLVALSQRGGIDLWSVIEQERWLVSDTPTDVLGPGVSSFLCQVIASRVQMLTFRRPALCLLRRRVPAVHQRELCAGPGDRPGIRPVLVPDPPDQRRAGSRPGGPRGGGDVRESVLLHTGGRQGCPPRGEGPRRPVARGGDRRAAQASLPCPPPPARAPGVRGRGDAGSAGAES